MEAYDSIGAWQTTEKGDRRRHRHAPPTSPIGAKTVHVTGAVDLMKADRDLAGGAALLRAEAGCTYAYERVAHQPGRLHRAEPGGQDGHAAATTIHRNLITDLTQSQTFRYRAKELP